MAGKGIRNPRWGGGISEYPNHSLMKKIRLEVLREANYICQVCGGKATEIHHKDKTKDNHQKENFLAVCHKCHMGKLHAPPTQGKHWTWTNKAKVKRVTQLREKYRDKYLKIKNSILVELFVDKPETSKKP